MGDSVMIVDRFSAGLDDLKISEQRSIDTVLLTLDRSKRFSVFEATANDAIAKTMDRIFDRGYVKNIGGSYPWTHIEITPAGRAILDAAKSQEPHP